jgi:LCP family protein required for cell wall assembly
MKLRAAALVLSIALVATIVPLVGSEEGSSAAPLLVGRVHESFQPEKGKIFVLFIGHDARPGQTSSRADAIHIAGINTKTMKGGILNFPRDSWISIPGSGPGRINEALYRGGHDLLARTLESMTGIRLDYWVMTSFRGFQRAVGQLGGVKMKLPQAIYDPGGSGARLNAGKQVLAGYEALAFVRARKVLGGGDVARTTNQARFMLATLKKLRGEVDRNPAALLRWMSIVRRNTDMDVTAEELFRLGVLASQVKPKKVGNVTVPVSLGSVGAASVVFISSSARSIYDRFKKNGSL